MKERLVEDWLIKINERGYEVAFCQILLSKGFRIVRSGHSPTEHGKDVLAIAPDGSVHAYQLKAGEFAQGDILKYRDQLSMLVESRPIHPGLPATFDYHPFLVTTGEFKDPAVSLVREMNASWECRGLRGLVLVNGRQLHVDLVALSSDFWPTESPAVRRFRELYLVDGRGDLDLAQFARFLTQLLCGAKSGLDLERRVSAANIFASYLLDEFSRQRDLWSIFQGWTVCAAQIAWAGESGNFAEKHWKDSFEIAKEAAVAGLVELGHEVLEKDAFRVRDRELDDLTRTRNTIAVAGAACWQLIARTFPNFDDEKFQKAISISLDLIGRGRLYVWGEGAIPQFLLLIWFLEHAEKYAEANSLLMGLIEGVTSRNAKDSEMPFEDPYVSADECLAKVFSNAENVPQRQMVESYTLFPLILLAARRKLRSQLEKAWPQISGVAMTWFEPAKPADELNWQCDNGKEISSMFARPQSWKELCEVAYRDRSEFLPQVVRNDLTFGLLFILAFPHRFNPRLVKHLDTLVTVASRKV